jgi:hypothetical protein
MRYLIVEGITDVAFIKYICLKEEIIEKFNDFKQKNEQIYKFNDLTIINIQGQNNLEKALSIIQQDIGEIKKIGIIQDADNNFVESKENIEIAINNSKIDKNKISYFLTPNNADVGNLETLLLSTLETNEIPQLKCFTDYKNCLGKNLDLATKAMDKAELYSYTMFFENGKNRYTPQNSFMYKKNKKYLDIGLWNINKIEFKQFIDFIKTVFA